MRVVDLSSFTGGWLVGDFQPNVLETGLFEFGVKYFKQGDMEQAHYQIVAHELSVVVSGSCRIGEVILEAGQALLIEPGETAGFEALSDCAIAVVKWPSLPNDKVLA